MDEIELKGRPGFWLRIDNDGFTMKYLLTRSHFEWSDVKDEFRVVGPYVAFDIAEPARSSSRLRRVYAAQRRSLGFDAGIQARSYRIEPEALADLLNGRRQAALSRSA